MQGSDNTPAAYRSTVDTSELQHAPDLKPLKINRNNFESLSAQGDSACYCLAQVSAYADNFVYTKTPVMT